MPKSPKQLNSYYAGVIGAENAADQAQKAPSSSFFSGRQQSALNQIPSQVTDQKQGSSPVWGVAKGMAKRLGLRR